MASGGSGQFDGSIKFIRFKSNLIDEPPIIDEPTIPLLARNTFMKVCGKIFCCVTSSSVFKIESWCYRYSSDEYEEDNSEYEIIMKKKKYNPVGSGANINFPEEKLSTPIQATSPDPGIYIHNPLFRNHPAEGAPGLTSVRT